MRNSKVGLGGGCHWCTEGVFQSLKGITSVEQGWIASAPPNEAYSEAVIVCYNPNIISLKDLIEIHLHTHSATSRHSMRDKYRSAIYTYGSAQSKICENILHDLQPSFDNELVTEVLMVKNFKINQPEFLNYYYSNPNKPFCKNFIEPKLRLVLEKFSKVVNHAKFKATGNL